MSEEQLPKGQTVEKDVKDETPQPQTVSIQDILNTYPIDREKCRDVLLVEMSKSLIRIADSIEAVSQSLVVINTHLSEVNTLTKKQME